MPKKAKGPKLKTHRASAARLHVTGSGKIMRRKVGQSHLRNSKSHRTKRSYGKKVLVEGGFKARVRRLIPFKG
ncbi:MAG: 50S ribosomal protein L35 [Dehalococcoidia bacterium]|nr:50S ribosomal protein L35 [Dehalococcoidia bacterium]